MKWTELQKQLDEKKWIESERAGYDKSGTMPYCAKCTYNDSGKCTIPQSIRIKKLTCVRARCLYNGKI